MSTTKPNTRPLRTALKKLQEARAKSDKFEKEIDDQRADIKEREASLDIDNAKGVKALAARRQEVEELPRLLGISRSKIGGYAEEAIEAAEGFERELLAAAAEEREAVIEEIAETLRSNGYVTEAPRADNGEVEPRARYVALRCDAPYEIPAERIGNTSLPLAHERANLVEDQDALERFDASVIARAEELLEVYERWKSNGRSFRPRKA